MESTDRTPRRALRVVLTVAAVLVVVMGAAVAWLLLAGEDPRPVTVEEARKRTDGATGSTTPSGEFGPPAPGVYLYEGEGREQTSFPPLTEEQGPTMPATVTADGPGCWRFRIDYNTHHWQEWRYCGDPSGITSTGGQTFARRDFGSFQVDNTTSFTCEEPEVWLWEGMEVGESRDSTCSGTSTAIEGSAASTGPTIYVGDEDIAVGDETVRARHLRYERDVSGAQEGSQRADWWVDPTTLLPIRNEHRVEVDTKLGSLTITYSEVTSYTLTSLTPE